MVGLNVDEDRNNFMFYFGEYYFKIKVIVFFFGVYIESIRDVIGVVSIKDNVVIIDEINCVINSVCVKVGLDNDKYILYVFFYCFILDK